MFYILVDRQGLVLFRHLLFVYLTQRVLVHYLVVLLQNLFVGILFIHGLFLLISDLFRVGVRILWSFLSKNLLVSLEVEVALNRVPSKGPVVDLYGAFLLYKNNNNIINIISSTVSWKSEASWISSHW